ncbi:uncharacterized protein LOC128397475 [Panonychus citri]|uniref:uncharacterized protein LOC128397475 n=1 Tax=Panonychus citri TaxID=50023 RepID=UPI002306EC39|nr:uncharacterized protein LOC128397475 [Panonychus citri]
MRTQSSLLILIVTISFSLITITNAAEKKKSTKLTQVDTSSECESALNQTVTILEPAMLVGTQPWPMTMDAVTKHCELGTKVYKNVRRYGKCLNGLSRQAVTIFLRGLKKFMQNICLSSKKKMETIEILKCASNETMTGWSKCLNTANQQLDFTASNATDPAMIGNICCTYSSLVECVSVSTGSKPDCIKPGRQDTSTFLESSLSLIVKDLTELLCGNYATKEDCDAHNAGRAESLKLIADGKYKVTGAFLLSPLIKATKQLGEIHADDI